MSQCAGPWVSSRPQTREDLWLFLTTSGGFSHTRASLRGLLSKNECTIFLNTRASVAKAEAGALWSFGWTGFVSASVGVGCCWGLSHF